MPALETASLPTLPAPPPAPYSGERLSLRLRSGTAAAHEAVEHATGLPDAVADMAGYRACLQGFASVILPLERSLRLVAGWEDYGITSPNARGRRPFSPTSPASAWSPTTSRPPASPPPPISPADLARST
jgi:hypothetical protein